MKKLLVLAVLLTLGFVPAHAEKAKKPKESPALFQGKDAKTFGNWAREQITFPNDTIARMVIYFDVDKRGTVNNVRRRSIGDTLFVKQVKKIVESSPEWTPERKKGKPVVSSHILLVDAVQDKIEMIESDEEYFTMPTFQGGDLNTFRSWAMSQLIYPEILYRQGIEGRVVMSFTINKDGWPVFKEVVHSDNYYFLEEVVRVMKLSPKWTPATKFGEPVEAVFIFPIDFKFPIDFR